MLRGWLTSRSRYLFGCRGNDDWTHSARFVPLWSVVQDACPILGLSSSLLSLFGVNPASKAQ
eukprot:6483764-Karenia_brevis.AAC.1